FYACALMLRQAQHEELDWVLILSLSKDEQPSRVLKRALDGFDVEAFDDVALLHVLVVGERHAALLAGLHLAHLVLETLERRKLAFVDHDIVADEAHPRAAAHDTVGDAAAGNLADLGDREDLEDLRVAEQLFA